MYTFTAMQRKVRLRYYCLPLCLNTHYSTKCDYCQQQALIYRWRYILKLSVRFTYSVPVDLRLLGRLVELVY